MNWKFWAAAFSACSLAMIGSASAQGQGGWYSTVSGSLTLREDATGTIANAPVPGATVRNNNPIEPGVGGQVSVGRKIGKFRLEAELGYSRETQNRYESVVPATGQIFADVTENRIRAMVNGYVDFDAGPVQPFVGIGAGYASTDLEFIAARAPFPTEQPRRLIDDSDAAFAWQTMAGIAVPVNDRLNLTLQYRWFDGGSFDGVDLRGESVSRDISGHNVDIGIRLSF